MGPWRRRPETCRCGTRLRCLWGSHVLPTQDPTAGGDAVNSNSLYVELKVNMTATRTY